MLALDAERSRHPATRDTGKHADNDVQDGAPWPAGGCQRAARAGPVALPGGRLGFDFAVARDLTMTMPLPIGVGPAVRHAADQRLGHGEHPAPMAGESGTAPSLATVNRSAGNSRASHPDYVASPADPGSSTNDALTWLPPKLGDQPACTSHRSAPATAQLSLLERTPRSVVAGLSLLSGRPLRPGAARSDQPEDPGYRRAALARATASRLRCRFRAARQPGQLSPAGRTSLDDLMGPLHTTSAAFSHSHDRRGERCRDLLSAVPNRFSTRPVPARRSQRPTDKRLTPSSAGAFQTATACSSRLSTSILSNWKPVPV